MIDWNLALMLAVAAFTIAAIGWVWILVRALRHERLHWPWLLAMGLLSLGSVVTAGASQVTVESKLSSGGGEDGE